MSSFGFYKSSMRTVLILGSARHDGEAASLAEGLKETTQWDLIDLNNYSFGHFDYHFENQNDDFPKLIRRIIEDYDVLVFVTPVYWYTMSGIMKVFFDRISDLLMLEKELGRKLRGKKMAVVSCSYGNNLGEHFWLPFSETAKYLGIEYLGGLHTISGNYDRQAIATFCESLKS